MDAPMRFDIVPPVTVTLRYESVVRDILVGTKPVKNWKPRLAIKTGAGFPICPRWYDPFEPVAPITNETLNAWSNNLEQRL